MDLIDKNIDNVISTDSAKTCDDSLKENAEFAEKAGLEVHVVRKYDGVCLSNNRQCEWCLDRCGEYDNYVDAYQSEAFVRHPGCGCTIEYTSRKGEKTVSTGKNSGWKRSDDAEERIRKSNYASLDGCEKAIFECDAEKIQYKEVMQLSEKLSSDEIIDKVGGGDETDGSCQSVALAYAGNVLGYDVRDFRGGRSCDIFSRPYILREIAKTDGVAGFIVRDYNGFNSAYKALGFMEHGKEYIFSTGEHAAIVRRKSTKGIEYLELQDPIFNGFKNLTTTKLKERFDVKKQHSHHGNKVEQESILVDINSLQNNDSFIEMLGYINTAEDDQEKGAFGSAK